MLFIYLQHDDCQNINEQYVFFIDYIEYAKKIVLYIPMLS